MQMQIEEIIDYLIMRAIFCETNVEADCLIQIIKAIRAWQGELA
jgi:hypothetical protein